jgi:hypothetical protein
MGIERRRAVRHYFGGVAEVIQAESGMQLIGPATGLSQFGCFVKTKTRFAQGSSIRVRITQGDTAFAALGSVVNVTAEGMGIAFAAIKASEQTVLEKWLTQAAR